VSRAKVEIDWRPIPPSKWWMHQPERIKKLRSGHIVTDDALSAMKAIRAEVADIVFLDPPFNLGKRYGNSPPRADKQQRPAYADFLRSILLESARVLRPGGSLFFYHIPKVAVATLPDLSAHLSFRHWIAIGMKNGFVRNNNLYPAHYALLHYTKGEPRALTRPKIQPSTCPHCGEVTRDYGGYSEHVIDGVNLSDFWDDVSPVRHGKYKYRKENELPMLVVKRAVAIAGIRSGLLVDVFAGTGGAAVAARSNNMRYIAIDREESNTELIIDRMQHITKHRKTPDA